MITKEMLAFAEFMEFLEEFSTECPCADCSPKKENIKKEKAKPKETKKYYTLFEIAEISKNSPHGEKAITFKRKNSKEPLIFACGEHTLCYKELGGIVPCILTPHDILAVDWEIVV